MGFADDLDALDAGVREQLTDLARYRAGGEGVGVDLRVILERPSEIETLQSGSIVVDRPTLEVEVVTIPDLRKGDTFDQFGRRYRVAGKPSRPGDGRWWLTDLEDLGPVA